MTRLKISQVRSTIGCKQNQRETLRSLGLKRIGDVVAHEDRPEVRGMIKTVTHLILVEPIGEGEVD
jgi:large subunit ribosomal protein L30